MHSYGNFRPTEKTDFSAGISGSWVTNAKDLAVPEVRAFQSVTQQVIKIDNFYIHVRLRVEERFFHNTDSENINLTDGYRFKLRSRYRIQFQHISNNQNWTVRLADEIMYHTDSSDAWKFDQNRVYVGIERKLTKQLGLEIGYMLLHALSRDNIIYSNNLRTTLYHRISL